MARILQRWRGKALRSSEPAARLRAIEKLAAGRDAQSLTLLIDALHDDAPQVRLAAAVGLADRGAKDGLRPMIASMLAERELSVRSGMAEAVGRFDVKRIKPMLLMALDQPDLSVQKAAAWALRAICWSSVGKERRAQIAIVHAAWDEVVGYGKAAVKPLKTLLINGSAHARRSAAKALGEIGTFESYKALISVVDDASLDDEIRKTAAWAFRSFSWQWVDDAHLAIIAVLLEDWSAAVNLGPTAVAVLIDALRRKAPRVREGAAQALGEIATEEAMDALMRARSDPTQDHRVRSAAAKSLERIALATLAYPEMAVRASAARILDDLGWAPRDDHERTLLSIARGDWGEVRKIGSPALEALLGLVEQSQVTREAAAALVHLLTHEPECFSSLQLRQLSQLPDVDAPAAARRGRPRGLKSAARRVSCEQVRQAAKLVESRRRFN